MRISIGIRWSGSLVLRTMPATILSAWSRLCLLAAAGSSWIALVEAQPSPKVQKGITAAIKAAANTTSDIDYTQFVNVFIGTDNFGDVWSVGHLCFMPVVLTVDLFSPGASIPFGMVGFFLMSVVS